MRNIYSPIFEVWGPLKEGGGGAPDHQVPPLGPALSVMG